MRAPVSPAFDCTADAEIPVVTISSPPEDTVTGTEVRFRLQGLLGDRHDVWLPPGRRDVQALRPALGRGRCRPAGPIENLADGCVAVTYKRVATVKRMTPKACIYRRKLNERAIRKAHAGAQPGGDASEAQDRRLRRDRLQPGPRRERSTKAKANARKAKRR